MLVNCFAHIINCQKRHLHTSQCFHLHTCFTFCLYCTENMDPVLFLIQFIIDRTFLNRKRMTHGNQFRCFFHAHDSSHPRHAKDIAFFDISLRNACHDFRTYRNISGCQSSPISNILSGNIHHHCISFFIKMCKSIFHGFFLPEILRRLFWTHV